MISESAWLRQPLQGGSGLGFDPAVDRRGGLPSLEPADPWCAEGRLEGWIPLLVDHRKPGAFIGALRRRVADEDADLKELVVAVPARNTVGVTVVPSRGWASALRARMAKAISTVALAPFSGSRPAWAARPLTVTS